jgi:glucose-fructose oxidoreductase
MEPFYSRRDLRMRVFRGNTVEHRYMRDPDHFAAMMDHLAECAADGKEPLTDGVDGLNDMKVIMGCYESVRTGGVVKLT